MINEKFEFGFEIQEVYGPAFSVRVTEYEVRRNGKVIKTYWSYTDARAFVLEILTILL